MSAHLKAKMSLDAKGVKAGTDKATKSVGGFSSQLKKIGPQLVAAFSVGAIVGFTKQVIQYGSQISDLAYQTGLSTGELQAFQVAVTNAGGTVENAGKALLSLRDAQDAALNGEAMYADAFERLGITMEDLAGKSMPQLLEAVAGNYEELQDFGVLVDLFGKRNAGKLEEALISLAENGFDELKRSTEAAGLSLSDEQLWKLDAISDSWEKMLIRMKVGFADFAFSIEKIWRPVTRMFDAVKAGLFAGVGAVGTDLKNIFTGNWGEGLQTANLVGVMGDASSRSWEMDKKTEAAIDAERVKKQEERNKKQTDREVRQAESRAKKLAAIQATANSAEARVEAAKVAGAKAGGDKASAAKVAGAKAAADKASAAKLADAQAVGEKEVTAAKAAADQLDTIEGDSVKKRKGKERGSGQTPDIDSVEKIRKQLADPYFKGDRSALVMDAINLRKQQRKSIDDQRYSRMNAIGSYGRSYADLKKEDDGKNNKLFMEIAELYKAIREIPAPQSKELTALEKQGAEQTRLLRGIRNAQEISNFE